MACACAPSPHQLIWVSRNLARQKLEGHDVGSGLTDRDLRALYEYLSSIPHAASRA